MILRPLDASGDILPAFFSSALLRGAEAVAQLVRERLELLSGEWWEHPAWGNAALDMLREARFTEADQQALASYLTSYIRETPGVQEIEDVTFSAEAGRRFSYQCSIMTSDGSTKINYEL